MRSSVAAFEVAICDFVCSVLYKCSYLLNMDKINVYDTLTIENQKEKIWKFKIIFYINLHLKVV